MAQRSETLNFGTSPTLKPVPLVRPKAPEVTPVERLKAGVLATYQKARARAGRSYSSLAEQSSSVAAESRVLLHRAGARIERSATENPLQLAALVAGGAFLAGFMLRVWRSNHHA
ncbi:MAG: hypothetical protein JO356_14680 [Acidobacteria bacterium]|nr:hypothetical protein [Acidobacteriota bacterium]